MNASHGLGSRDHTEDPQRGAETASSTHIYLIPHSLVLLIESLALPPAPAMNKSNETMQGKCYWLDSPETWAVDPQSFRKTNK